MLRSAKFVNKSKSRDERCMAGLLKPLEVPACKSESITMDFVMGFPRTIGRYDAIWIIMDRLTKIAHFVPLQMDTTGKELADLFLQYQFKYHGCSRFIISDRDTRFTSHFLGEVFKSP
jgi:hypothetical protein